MSLQNMDSKDMSPEMVADEIIAMVHCSQSDILASKVMDGMIEYYVNKQAKKLSCMGLEECDDAARFSVIKSIAAMLLSESDDKDAFVENLKTLWLEATFIASKVEDSEVKSKEIQ